MRINSDLSGTTDASTFGTTARDLGVGDFIHDWTSSEARAKIAAELREAGVVGGEGDRFVDVVCPIVGDQVREVDVVQQRRTGAGDGCSAGERDDRDAHPQRIDARRVAVVGIGVERDVDRVVQREVAVARLAPHERDAFGWDAGALE